MKKRKIRKSKKTLTYAEAHNRAFLAYNKASRVIIWAAILNVIGLMVAIIQQAMTKFDDYFVFALNSLLGSTVVSSGFQFSLCYGINSFIFRLLEIPFANKLGDQTLSYASYIIILVIIAILISAITVYVSVLASQGKKAALYGEIIFYILDTFMIVGCYIIGEASEILWILIGLHVIVLFFLGMALFQYYKLFEIEKIYKIKPSENKHATKGSDDNETHIKK